MKRRLAAYWTGKSVLITGASSGLGAAVVTALAPYRVRFGLLSRRLEPMQDLAAQHEGTGSSFWMRSCDVRQREEVMQAVRDFHHHTGHLDVAWVNSGISRDSSFARWKWEVFENLVDTNLKGAVHTIIACLEIMVAQKSGAIVGIGSVSSMRGLGARGMYSATKIALDYFMESMAVELPFLQFTIIHPGFVDTPINQGNPHRLWLMQPPQAASIMIKAVARRKRLHIYPAPMRWIYRLVRLLPAAVYRPLARRAMVLSRPVNKLDTVETAPSSS